MSGADREGPTLPPGGADRKLAELLSALIDGRLSASERRRLIERLARSPADREVLARAVLCLVRSEPPGGAPPGPVRDRSGPRPGDPSDGGGGPLDVRHAVQ